MTKKQILKQIKKNYFEAIERINDCPYFPEYPSLFQPGKSKLELRQRLLADTQMLISQI